MSSTKGLWSSLVIWLHWLTTSLYESEGGYELGQEVDLSATDSCTFWPVSINVSQFICSRNEGLNRWNVTVAGRERVTIRVTLASWLRLISNFSLWTQPSLAQWPPWLRTPARRFTRQKLPQYAVNTSHIKPSWSVIQLNNCNKDVYRRGF